MFDFFTSTTEQVDYISYKYLFTKGIHKKLTCWYKETTLPETKIQSYRKIKSKIKRDEIRSVYHIL